jgi:hypothetical protein
MSTHTSSSGKPRSFLVTHIGMNKTNPDNSTFLLSFGSDVSAKRLPVQSFKEEVCGRRFGYRLETYQTTVSQLVKHSELDDIVDQVVEEWGGSQYLGFKGFLDKVEERFTDPKRITFYRKIEIPKE